MLKKLLSFCSRLFVCSIVLIVFSALFIFPALAQDQTAQAHGGVEKTAGNVTIVLYQDPLSPLVGENVQMTFVLINKNTFQPVANLPVHLNLTDTFFGDVSRDKIIISEDLKTDNNGSLQFSYTFTKENYFDVDLKFNDPIDHKAEDNGFLIQPRVSASKTNNLAALVIALLAGAIIGAGLQKTIHFKKPLEK